MAEPHRVTRRTELIADLRSNVSPAKWSTWFSGVRIELTEQTLDLVAPSDFHSHWLQDHYRELIASLASDYLGANTAVRYLTASPSLEPGLTQRPPDPPTKPAAEQHTPDDSLLQNSRYLDKYVFDNFIPGPSNHLAFSASMAVAERPGQHYNPLFLYGGAGLGKTHLLYAIAHRALTLRPDTSIRCMSSETFFNDFVKCIRNKCMDDFKHRFRNTDLLLLDDVQFFQGREQVLEELFHTFNSLHQFDKQVVLTCDRPPKDLGIEDRLRSRFQWGLLADIGPPTVETRLAILQGHAGYAPKKVPDAVLDFIAQHITDNIRELEGALTKVTFYAALTKAPITLDLAREQLADLIPTSSGRPPTATEIIAVVAASYGFSIADMAGPSRREPLVTARQIAMYLCRTLANLSLPQIGKHLHRDHTTVLSGIRKITRLSKADPQFAHRVADLSEKLCPK